MNNVGEILNRTLKIAPLDLLEIHGRESELAQLREPLADRNAAYWTLDDDFRREERFSIDPKFSGEPVQL